MSRIVFYKLADPHTMTQFIFRRVKHSR